MAGSFSDYAENKVLEHLVGKTSFTMPTVYIALVKAPVTDSSTGTSIAANEPSGGSYSRVAVAGTVWGSASGGSITNSNTKITFPTASASWGTVTYYALVDASSGGNILAWGDLTASKTVDSGDTIEFPLSSLTITLD